MRVVSKQLKVCQKKVRELEEERDLALESVADLDGKWRRKF